MKSRMMWIAVVVVLLLAVQSCSLRKKRKERKRGCKAATALFREGRAALGQSEYGKAAQACRLGLEESNNKCKRKLMAALYLDAARAEYELGEYEDAEEHIDRAYDIYTRIYRRPYRPERVMATMYQGKIYLARGKHREAEAKLLPALDMVEALYGPDNLYAADVLESLGMLYAQMGDFKTSLEYLDRAFEIKKKKLTSRDPRLAKTYSRIGDVYLMEENYDEAERYFKRTINLLPEYYWAHHQLGMVYMKKGEKAVKWGELDEARTLLKAAAKSFEKADILGSDYYCSLHLGMTEELMGDIEPEEKMKKVLYEHALSAYRDAIYLGEFIPEPFVKRAVVLNKLGREKEAIAELDKAIEFRKLDEKGAFSEGYAYKARFLANYGKRDHAIAVLKQCLKQMPGDEICNMVFNEISLPQKPEK